MIRPNDVCLCRISHSHESRVVLSGSNGIRVFRFILCATFFWLFAWSLAVACNIPTATKNLEQQLFIQINQERAKKGIYPFKLSPVLKSAARAHACENASHNRLSHSGLDGSTLGERVLRAGYDFQYVTENVAVGYDTPNAVLNAWLLSSSHRENIYDLRAVELGISVAIGQDGRMYWVMNGGIS